MTAPEREAQDKMAEILFLADNPTCVWAEYKTPNGHAYNRYMMLAKAALAASHAPAVTVTEDENCDEYRLAVAYQVIGCFLDHLGVFDTDGGQGLLDYFAKHDGAKDPLPFSVADLVASPRKSERDDAIEECAQLVESVDSIGMNRAETASEIRALKSTTPQTGSQE